MSAPALMDEFTFQARLRYLAFKRTVWLMETLLLVILLVVVYLLRIPYPWNTALVVLQAMRVAGEMWNHSHLAQGFNARDRWIWFPFIS